MSVNWPVEGGAQQAGKPGWLIAVQIVSGVFGLEILGLLISLGIT